MRQLLLILAIFICIDAQAQTQQTTTVKKTRKKARTAMTSRPPETYTSSRGKVKARSLGKYEQPDTVNKLDEDATHINSNYNESTPPLSPNSGSPAPKAPK
jgi:hypothetical protein